MPSLLRFWPRDSCLASVFSLSELCNGAGDCGASGVWLRRAITFAARCRAFILADGRLGRTRLTRVAIAVSEPWRNLRSSLLRQAGGSQRNGFLVRCNDVPFQEAEWLQTCRVFLIKACFLWTLLLLCCERFPEGRPATEKRTNQPHFGNNYEISHCESVSQQSYHQGHAVSRAKRSVRHPRLNWKEMMK